MNAVFTPVFTVLIMKSGTDMKYLLGIDFGGGASKATLLSVEGKIVATNTTEYPTNYPKPGYAEQNPDHWVQATCENIKGVLEKSGVSPEDICAVSLDAATHTAVIMDEDFNVIRPAIYWTDTRSTDEVAYLKKITAILLKNRCFTRQTQYGHCLNLCGLKITSLKIGQGLKRFCLLKTMYVIV